MTVLQVRLAAFHASAVTITRALAIGFVFTAVGLIVAIAGFRFTKEALEAV